MAGRDVIITTKSFGVQSVARRHVQSMSQSITILEILDEPFDEIYLKMKIRYIES